MTRVRPISRLQLALLLFELPDDFFVVSLHFGWDMPNIDRAGETQGSNIKGWSSRWSGKSPPCPTVTENSQASNVHVYAGWDVDVDVPEHGQDGDRRSLGLDLRLTEIQIDVSEHADGHRSPPEPQSPASDHPGEHPQRDSRHPARRRRRSRHDRRQVASDLGQLRADLRSIGELGTIRELVECQAPFHKIGSQGSNGALPIVVRDSMAGVHHGPNGTDRELRDGNCRESSPRPHRSIGGTRS